MRTTIPATSLRLFVGEAETVDGRPVKMRGYLQRVSSASRAPRWCAARSATGTSRLHTGKILRLCDDLPVIVELVDTAEAIERVLDAVEPMLDRCMVTMMPVQRLQRDAPAPQRER